MAYSYNDYTGNGSTTQFPVAFGYIRREHVAVTVASSPAAFTWVNDSLIQVTTTPANGAAVRVYRQTPLTAPLVDFADGATLVAADLDTNARQSIYTQQELDDSLVGVALGAIPNGDKGEITTSVGGTVWSINAGLSATKLSFTQSGTGAATRTVDSKLKDVVSVKDFGAVGDNTTNDTVAISSARIAFPNTSIDLAGASYRVTTIPAGWGFCNGLLTLDPASTDDQPSNEAYGYGALAANTYVPKQFPSAGPNYAAGNFNTAFGGYALGSNTTGRRQTAIGSQALRLNTTGFYNTALGAFALYTNVSGNYNTAIGNQTLQYSTGNNNCAVGNGALTSLTIGNDNVAIGDRSMGISAQVNRTIAIGTQAGQQHTGNDSIAIGHQALSAPSSSGLYNVAIGSASLGSCTTANSNVAVGRRSGGAITTAVGNTAIGNDAMVGSGTAITGSNNVAVGNAASGNITTGHQNVSIGASAGTALSTGFNNVFIGRFAAQLNTTGAGNTAIGEQSLSAVTTGDYNTAVGTGTVGGAAFTNTSMFGYAATVTGSNQVQLGDANTTTYVYGTVQNRSDARDKTDIQDTALGLDFIKALRPVDFRWDMRDDYRTTPPEPPADDATKEERVAHSQALQEWREANALDNLHHDGSKKRLRFHHGLIAQEVKAACDAAGVDFGGYQDHSLKGGEDVLSIGYEELIAPLIKAVQELSQEVASLKARLS
jgi:hypothetical protein